MRCNLVYKLICGVMHLQEILFKQHKII